MKRLRILIVDDQRIMRDGLATIIGLESGMEVVGTEMDGVEGSKLILKHFPETKVLILTLSMTQN